MTAVPTATEYPEVTSTIPLHKIDVNKPVPYAVSGFEGQSRCESDTDLPLSPSAKEAVRKLKEYLGKHAQDVTPRFVVKPGRECEDDTLVLAGLNATAIAETLLTAYSPTRPQNLGEVKKYNREQTDAIVARCPAVGAAKAM